MNRPSWNEYFLALAFIVSSRSKDEETKHGCIITDKNNVILGTGYNGPIKNIDDSLIPKKRPNKYPYFLHSESNAIFNCKTFPKDCGGGRAYVTGKCCLNCFQSLIQIGVDEFYMAKRQGTKLENEKTDKIFDFIVKNTNIKVEYLEVKFDWLFNFLEDIILSNNNNWLKKILNDGKELNLSKFKAEQFELFNKIQEHKEKTKDINIGKY